MALRKMPLWVLAVLFFAAACGKKGNQLTISKTNFADQEIAQQQNLVFTLNKDVFPDSLLQRWDSTVFIDITPKVAGRFKWNSSHELVFSPGEAFAPGTQYTARLTRQLLRYSKQSWPVDETPLSFHTAPLRVVQTHLAWTRGKSMANVVVQLDVDFNYEVNIAEAAAKLKLSAAGANVLTNTINTGTGKTLSVQFMPLQDRDAELPIDITLAAGLKVHRAASTLGKDTVIHTTIPSRYTLEVSDVSAQHSGLEGTIMVRTSQPLPENGLEQYVRLEPQVPFIITPDESGFVITSEALKADQTYLLELSPKLEGLFGGRMKERFSTQVSFGKLQPSVAFANSKGMYLSSRGYRNLALNIVNVPQVEVTVVKVYENNIEQFMRRGLDYGYEYDEASDDYGNYEYYNTEDLGDVVFTKVYDTEKLPRKNAARLLHLDFQDKIRGYDGVYVITVASKDHRWVQQSKILSLSDIGLIVKEDRDNIYVFANSIRNATPLEGVKVSFISTNNQLMHTVTTDGDGVARFADVQQKAPGFRLGLITARHQGEFNFIPLQQTGVELSRFDVGGRLPNDAGLNAMLYAERNLYRPGETMHVSAIVRDEQWNLPGEMPVKLRLMMPNGKEFLTMRKILNEQGATETSFSIPATAMTGTYQLELLTGNDVLLQQYAMSVEDFMPDRIKPTLRIDRKEYALGDSIRATLQADNLFGTPAAGRNYEFQLNVSKENFTAKAYPDYNFQLRNDLNFNTDFRNGKTSLTGGASAVFGLPTSLKDAGMLQGNVMATVFDENGRPVHRFEHFMVYTQPVFIGMKLQDYYVGTRSPMKIGLLAVNKSGTLVSQATVDVAIIRKEWHTVIQQEGSRYRYVSQKDEKVVRQMRVNTSSADYGLYFTPEISGEYEVRVALPGAGSYVSGTFYAWGAGDTRYTSFDVDNEGNIDIKLDQDKYQLGEDINVLFTTPFDGRILVTLERDKVIRHLYLSTNNKSASLRLKADEQAVPNVYISATLFRPMDGADLPLTVAHGFKSVPVENAQTKLPVAIAMAPAARSKSKQVVTVKTQPGAWVTIAAVDEGILQVKDYQTPDPHKYFYQKVALATRSYDIYPFLLPEVAWNASSTGGDGAAESAMRVNPMFVNRVKNVSFWSGILQADGRGEVRYTIDIPQFSGDIRAMAVAYKGKAFGSADNHMKVADPIVISSGLPRFLSPKDEVLMPVTLSNTTNKPITASVAVQTNTALSVSQPVQTITIPANREQRVVYTLRAGMAIGKGNVRVTVKTPQESYVDETDISIRPPASLQHLTGTGIAREGVPATLSVTNNFLPATASGYLVAGKSPLVALGRQLDYLIQYPYGCIEQTVSAAFPQLYYADLVRSMTGNTSSDLNPAHNVQQAILKIQSMQLSNGSLSYWPEGGEETWWGSVYATHFLLEARKAGYEVNSRTLDRLLQYLKFKLNKRETEILYYNQNLKKEIAAKSTTYSLYVLAMAGMPQQNTMNYYKAHPEMLAIDGRYLLAAAYALSGQGMQAKAVLPQAFSGELSKKVSAGSFYSQVRDMALALHALLDIDPASPQVAEMARLLSQSLQREKYLNTQESVWGILAMGKIARATNKANLTATISAGGKSIATTNGEPVRIDLKPYLGQALNISVKDKGSLYYFWQASGITNDGSYKQEDSYLKVRRTYLTRDGREITGNKFRQNQLVVVRLTLEGIFDADVNNVVITDMLPAGFEIENARLVSMPGLNWLKMQSTPDYVDVRDDRINIFTSEPINAAGSQSMAAPAAVTFRDGYQEFYYMVRAVSPGTYQLGPVQAEAMYNAFYHSYHGAGQVVITAE